MTHRCWRLVPTALAASMLLTVVAAGDELGSSAEEHVAQAQKYVAAGDLRAGQVALKNAVARDPASVAARRLLGDLYLELGDGASAEKEIRRARELGLPAGESVRPLALALLMQGKAEAVLNEITAGGAATPEERAMILALRGEAHGALDSMTGRNNLAWVLLHRGDLAGARVHIDRARALAPEDPVAMDTDAEILIAEKKPAEAIPLLREAAARLPGLLGTRYRLTLTLALFQTGEPAETPKLLETVTGATTPFDERSAAEALLKEIGG
ncbi:MAG: tetratricopeptide repeat protein [Alphaproteobacteria bacterium]|nr:tetratricopeptide repeat protein [Alphaproteobacteria bacterium]